MLCKKIMSLCAISFPRKKVHYTHHRPCYLHQSLSLSDCTSKWSIANIMMHSQMYTACSSRIFPVQALHLYRKTPVFHSAILLFKGIWLHWNKNSHCYMKSFLKTIPSKKPNVKNLERYHTMNIKLLGVFFVSSTLCTCGCRSEVFLPWWCLHGNIMDILVLDCLFRNERNLHLLD